MEQIELYKRRFERERAARLEAESILESKSLELHESKVAVETAAKELRSQNVRIHAIVDSAAEGIVTVDFECNILTFNPAAERILRLSQRETVGHSFVELIDGLESTVISEFFSSSENRLEPKEYTVNFGNDEKVIIEVTLSKTIGDDWSSMIAIVRDRTKSRNLESQLAIAQKMESIGQLSAGIAHEINSPMQYVSDNTRFLKEAFEDVESLLKKYDELVQAVKSSSATAAIVDAIEQQYEESDFDFTLEEVPEAIDQTIVGAERVTKIVHAMKVFSHPGETDPQGFYLNDAVQSTLDVAKNEWKYVAEVDLDLQADLPMSVGFPSKLNQALLNLVVNCAHAIAKRRESEKGHEGKIEIATRAVDDHLELTISDNGCGIPTESLRKIYDPFFTTKPVGKGTGQGLSITHSIVVETHNGNIDVESVVGEGTKFTLQLPICANEFELTNN